VECMGCSTYPGPLLSSFPFVLRGVQKLMTHVSAPDRDPDISQTSMDPVVKEGTEAYGSEDSVVGGSDE